MLQLQDSRPPAGTHRGRWTGRGRPSRLPGTTRAAGEASGPGARPSWTRHPYLHGHAHYSPHIVLLLILLYNIFISSYQLLTVYLFYQSSFKYIIIHYFNILLFVWMVLGRKHGTISTVSVHSPESLRKPWRRQRSWGCAAATTTATAWESATQARGSTQTLSWSHNRFISISVLHSNIYTRFLPPLPDMGLLVPFPLDDQVWLLTLN